MLESVIVKPLLPNNVEYLSPKNFKIVGDKEDDATIYDIGKGAEDYIAKHLKLKTSTSRDVYKIDLDIWNEIVKVQLENNKDRFKFDNSNLVYLCSELNTVVDMFTFKDRSELDKFCNKLEKYIIDLTTMEKTNKIFTDGKDDTVKLICYDKNIDIVKADYTPIIILELNTKKSKYLVYTGILMYSEFIIFPSFDPILEIDKFSSFIYYFDMNEYINKALEDSEDLYKLYNATKELDCEISARELLSIIKSAGYKLELKDDNNIGEIKNLVDEEANLRVQEFFNTFSLVTNESAVDVIRLSDVQKIFRYNKLTFLDVLKILSKEYVNYEGYKITANLLSSIMLNLYNKHNDKEIMKIINREVNGK